MSDRKIQIATAMLLMIVLLVIVTIYYIFKFNDYYCIMALCRRFKGVNGVKLDNIATVAKGKTIFANTFDFIGLNAADFFSFGRSNANKYKRGYIFYVLGTPIYNVIKAEEAELILSDTNLITKGNLYTMFEKFVGKGLLTSTDKKWYSRRKVLTPGFHFSILEQFLKIFKEESVKFVESLKKLEDEIISLGDVIPKFTLNNVCETALGVTLDNILEGDEYRRTISDVERIFVKRVTNPLFFNDTIYKWFGEMDKYLESCEKAHYFSSEIIKKRRTLLSASKLKTKDAIDDEEGIFGKKKRYAMLDTLLEAEAEGLIDHLGICEEVDTFMFAGYDTTSMALTFGIMSLAQHQDIQENCYQEIQRLIAEKNDTSSWTIADYSNLKYLECFIKETLRMYPSVPFIQRKCTHETILKNNLFLPKGAIINIRIFDIHRDARHFSKPNEFDPNRFLPENIVGRHPFAYIPFSAGSRNCIGQKFAMLEIKVLLVNMIMNFKIQKGSEKGEFNLETGIILRSQHNINVKISKRE